MEKTNIRVQVTRKILRESLVTLMKTKSILNITVKEICEAAGVSRTTFYAYYKDQYDILRQMEKEILADVDKFTLKYSSSGEMAPIRELVIIFEPMLQYIVANSNSIQVLLSENGESGFQRRLFSRYIIGHMRKLKKSQSSALIDERYLKYYSVFVRDGFIAIVQEWLKSGMDININDMAKIFAKMLRGVLTQ
jgi:AcrR family transcriptional regulator